MIGAGGERKLRPHSCIALILALACAVFACKKTNPGRQLAAGVARDILVAPGGAMVAFLQSAKHPDDRGVPEDLLLGDLLVAAASGSDTATFVASGVPTLASAHAFSPGGEWLALLAQWRFREGEGELWLAQAGGSKRKVAEGVSAMAWAPTGTLLAYVTGGRLMILDASKERTGPALALDGIQTFAWSQTGQRLAGRAPAASGGRVALMDVASRRVREVARASSDFAFTEDDALYVLGVPGAKGGDRTLSVVEGFAARPREIGRATSFVASGDDVLLLSTERQPGEAFGMLLRTRRDGAAPEQLGERVSDFRLSSRGDAVFLARYDARARAGTLMVAARGNSPRQIASRVQTLTLEKDRILYIEQAPQKGDFKVELWTAPLDGSAPPRKIDEGVYGYQLTPDGKDLLWKARCAGGARSCSLLEAPADGSGGPRLIAANVAGFELSADGSRILVQQPHHGAARAVDLAVVSRGSPPRDGAAEVVAAEVDPGSTFVDPRGHRIVYATLSVARAGVFLLDVP
ncbi:MAG TPA: hypothetical protein VG496_00355 [Myxococcales bacterium]|nr:hypothetical protein [Myxococcales bacterium]